MSKRSRVHWQRSAEWTTVSITPIMDNLVVRALIVGQTSRGLFVRLVQNSFVVISYQLLHSPYYNLEVEKLPKQVFVQSHAPPAQQSDQIWLNGILDNPRYLELQLKTWKVQKKKL